MKLHIERGPEVACRLFSAFQTSGIHGLKEMPEDMLPAGVAESSLEHLLFITLTVSIDYQRDSVALWEKARAAFENPQTRYLFDPHSAHETSCEKFKQDMMETGLSQKHEKDCLIWRTISDSFLKKWQGDPRNFLADCNWDAVEILSRLRSDTHTDNNKSTWCHRRTIIDPERRQEIDPPRPYSYHWDCEILQGGSKNDKEWANTDDKTGSAIWSNSVCNWEEIGHIQEHGKEIHQRCT
jgi:hypothetical protein